MVTVFSMSPISRLTFPPFLAINMFYSNGRYKVDYSTTEIFDNNKLAKFVKDYWDYGNIVLSLLFNVATTVKLIRLNQKKSADWTKEKATLELLFVLQVRF